MATRVLPFSCVIPGNTLETAPVTIPINLDGWNIERLDLEVPPGTAGLMGFQLYNNGVAYIPYGPGEWIVWDDHSDTYYLEDLPNAGGWAVVGYNGGVYQHTVIVRAHVSPANTAAATVAAPVLTFVTTATPDPEPATF